MTTRTLTISISDNRDIGKGWRVCLFGIPANPNIFARMISESFHRTERAARKRAKELAATYGAKILD